MSDGQKKQPIAIRTFAADLESVRASRGETTNEPADKTNAVTDADSATETKLDKKQPSGKGSVFLKAATPIPTAPKDDTPVPIPPKPAPEEKPEKKESPQRIPAFHELEKTKPAIIQENITVAAKKKSAKKKKRKQRTPKAEPIIANTTNKKRPAAADLDATVITDNKSRKFRLLPAIVASIKKWFASREAERKRKAIPTHTVPEAGLRKGVIQKATSKTGTVFTSDNQTLKEQIRKRGEHSVPDISDGITEVVWSPQTESGYLLLDEPDTTQNVAVEFKRVHTASTDETATEPAKTNTVPDIEDLDEARWAAGSEPKRVEKKVSTPTPPIEPKREPVVIPEPKPVAPEPELITPEPEAATEATEPEPEIIPETTPEPEAVEPEPTEPASRTEHRWVEHDTNTLTVLLLLSVVAFVIIILGIRIVITELNEVEATPEPSVPTVILEHTTLVNIPLVTTSQAAFAESINTAAKDGPAGLIELSVVDGQNDEVSPSIVFGRLGFDPIPALEQSLIRTHFTSLNHGAPALVLEFVDQDTVYGGLLQWEDTLVYDLQILYPTLTPSETPFTDDTIAGVDVRILKDGATTVVYGMLSENTALITTSQSDFKQIVELGMKR